MNRERFRVQGLEFRVQSSSFSLFPALLSYNGNLTLNLNPEPETLNREL
jgi:hypothetical protein